MMKWFTNKDSLKERLIFIKCIFNGCSKDVYDDTNLKEWLNRKYG